MGDICSLLIGDPMRLPGNAPATAVAKYGHDSLPRAGPPGCHHSPNAVHGRGAPDE